MTVVATVYLGQLPVLLLSVLWYLSLLQSRYPTVCSGYAWVNSSLMGLCSVGHTIYGLASMFIIVGFIQFRRFVWATSQ